MGTQLVRAAVERARRLAEVSVLLLVTLLVVGSAILTKHATHAPALAVVDRRATPTQVVAASTTAQPTVEIEVESVDVSEYDADLATETRWFNGRPIRPARVLWMTVTAYSPDARSCGIFADGKTATLHSVWTNGMKLVAADTDILPFGSMLSIPGYDDGRVVPVLDRGGAIKGMRLDVLYPSHARARQWGVQRLPVVQWEYADGLPPDNPRAFR
ncbi:MAG: 3D domain-containing protein [Planctomycetota bacterium]